MGLRYAPLSAYLPPAFRFGGGKYDDDFAVRQRRDAERLRRGSLQRGQDQTLLFLQREKLFRYGGSHSCARTASHDDDRDVRHASLFFFLFREAATTRSTVSGSGV